MTPESPTPDTSETAYTGKNKVYYEALVQLRDELVDEVRTLSDHSLTFNKQAGEELADIGSDNFIREMELGLLSDEGRKIQLIQEALTALKKGSYGECVECSEPIGDARLEALPYARYCVKCKSKLEQMQRDGVIAADGTPVE